MEREFDQIAVTLYAAGDPPPLMTHNAAAVAPGRRDAPATRAGRGEGGADSDMTSSLAGNFRF